MSQAMIAAHGSDTFMQLARFEDKEFRANQWGGLLIDNDSGQIVNRASGSLHYEDHMRMLDDVVAARKYMPTAYDALVGAPGIGVSVSLYETLVGYTDKNEFTAQTSMNGSNRTSNETNYKFSWVPQPIYHTDFHIPWRQGGFAYKQADGTTEAVMQVALERDRTMMLGNDDIVVQVNGVDAPLFGLTNHPAVLTLAGGISDWAANPQNIPSEMVDLIAQLFTERKSAQVPNSIQVFVANDIFPQFDQDYSTLKGDRTVAERVAAITAIKGVLPSQWLPDGAVSLVEVTPMTLRIPTSTDITVAPWTRTNQMESLRFTVFAASTIQIRADRNNLTGIIYATK